MNIASGTLEFDLADFSLGQGGGKPRWFFGSGRVEVDGQSTWADVQLVTEAPPAHLPGGHLTISSAGWWGEVVVDEAWFQLIQQAFFSPVAMILNIKFKGYRSEIEQPLTLTETSLTLVRSTGGNN